MKFKKCTNSECESVGQLLPLSDFDRERAKRDGRRSQCKTCERRRKQAWRATAEGKLYEYNYARSTRAKAAQKKFRQSEKGKVERRQNWQRYRARKINAFVAEVDRQEIFERDGGKCHICRKRVDPNNWHLDHIIPIINIKKPANPPSGFRMCSVKSNCKIIFFT